MRIPSPSSHQPVAGYGPESGVEGEVSKRRSEVEGLRVLVVEDDPKIASMLAKGLRAKRIEVETVTTGLDALARVERGGVELALLDLGLPDMDGLEVLRRVRATGNSLRVIVITARSDPADRATAMQLGVADYLTKPFAWKQLWAAIEGS